MVIKSTRRNCFRKHFLTCIILIGVILSMNRNRFIKTAVCSLGILFLFLLLFLILGDQHNLLFPVFERSSKIIQMISLLLLNMAIFFVFSILFRIHSKRKSKLLYLIPFITALVLTVIYGRGRLQYIDPTNIIEMQISNLLTSVFFFLAVSLLEAAGIAICGFFIRKHFSGRVFN